MVLPSPPPKHPSTLPVQYSIPRSTSSNSISPRRIPRIPPPKHPDVVFEEAKMTSPKVVVEEVEARDITDTGITASTSFTPAPIPAIYLPVPAVLEYPPTPPANSEPSAFLPPSVSTDSLSVTPSDSAPVPSLHVEEEALEHLAFEIAQATRFGATEGFETRFATTLRRKITVKNHGEESNVERTRSDSEGGEPMTQEDKEIREALQIMEDEEVARFLDRVGKQVTEVRAIHPRSEIVFPEPTSFTDSTGGTHWMAFGKAYALTAIEAYTPPSLLAPPVTASFSVSTTKNQLERLYAMVPLSFWEELLQGSLARIWRWDPRARTWLWASIYTLLWTTNRLPLFPPAALLFLLLRRVLYPPTPAQLLTKSRARSIRAVQAAELSHSWSPTSQIGGLVMEGAKGLLGGIRARSSSNVGSGGGSMLAQALLSTTSLATATAASSPPTSGATKITVEELNSGGDPTSTTSTTIPPLVSNRAKATEEKELDISFYKLAGEARAALGPDVQEYLGVGADLGEKIKNLFVHSDHPSTNGVLLRLTLVCLVILFCPSSLLIKFIFFYLGFEFFVLWSLRESYPEYRRALNPIWWILLDAPTDAEYAMYILRKRKLEGKPLRGSKTIRRMSKARSREGSDVGMSNGARTKDGEQSATSSPRRVSRASAIGVQLDSLLSKAPSFTEEISGDILGSHFALFRKLPGNLLLTSSRISFVPQKGFRTIGLKLDNLKAKRKVAGDVSDSDSITSFDDPNASLGFVLKMEDLVGVKKEARYGFEGLELKGDDGKIWTLTNVSRRDYAFNILVSNSACS